MSVMRKYGHITYVGVFVNASVGEVRATIETCGLALAQLHGDETTEMVKSLDGKALKAFRGVPEKLDGFARSHAPALLIDASVKGAYGGTGVTADWNGAAELARRYPILLAGGLTPENVGEAVRRVRPCAVDVSSGVESAKGVKDAARIAAFTGATYSPPSGDPKTFTITVNGKTVQVTIEEDAGITSAVSAINKALRDANVTTLTASERDGALHLEATRYGSAFSFSVEGSGDPNLDQEHLGRDVAGEIGERATVVGEVERTAEISAPVRVEDLARSPSSRPLLDRQRRIVCQRPELPGRRDARVPVAVQPDADPTAGPGREFECH